MWGGILGPQICNGQNIEDTPNHGKSSSYMDQVWIPRAFKLALPECPSQRGAGNAKTADTLMVVYHRCGKKRRGEIEMFPV